MCCQKTIAQVSGIRWANGSAQVLKTIKDVQNTSSKHRYSTVPRSCPKHMYVVMLVPQISFTLNLSNLRLVIQLKMCMLGIKFTNKAWSHWLLLVSEDGGDRCSVSWLSLVQIIVMKAARTSVMLAAFFLWEYVENFSRDLRDTWFFDSSPIQIPKLSKSDFRTITLFLIYFLSPFPIWTFY
jgi:hypothetical protein